VSSFKYMTSATCEIGCPVHLTGFAARHQKGSIELEVDMDGDSIAELTRMGEFA